MKNCIACCVKPRVRWAGEKFLSMRLSQATEIQCTLPRVNTTKTCMTKYKHATFKYDISYAWLKDTTALDSSLFLAQGRSEYAMLCSGSNHTPTLGSSASVTKSYPPRVRGGRTCGWRSCNQKQANGSAKQAVGAQALFSDVETVQPVCCASKSGCAHAADSNPYDDQWRRAKASKTILHAFAEH